MRRQIEHANEQQLNAYYGHKKKTGGLNAADSTIS